MKWPASFSDGPVFIAVPPTRLAGRRWIRCSFSTPLGPKLTGGPAAVLGRPAWSSFDENGGGPGVRLRKSSRSWTHEPIAGSGEALKRAVNRQEAVLCEINGPASFLTGPFSSPFRRQGLPDDYGSALFTFEPPHSGTCSDHRALKAGRFIDEHVRSAQGKPSPVTRCAGAAER
jgi:hypothetical protein